MSKKDKLKFLLEIREKMKNTKDKCRWCGEGEGNNHNEGIHLINSLIRKIDKKICLM